MEAQPPPSEAQGACRKSEVHIVRTVRQLVAIGLGSLVGLSGGRASYPFLDTQG